MSQASNKRTVQARPKWKTWKQPWEGDVGALHSLVSNTQIGAVFNLVYTELVWKSALNRCFKFSEWKPDILCLSGSIGRDLSTWGNIAVTDTDTYDTVTTIIATTVRMKTAMIDICLWMFWQRENMKCMNEYKMKTMHIDRKNLNFCQHTWLWMSWRKSYELHTPCIFLLKVCLPQCSCTLANNVISTLKILVMKH